MKSQMIAMYVPCDIIMVLIRKFVIDLSPEIARGYLEVDMRFMVAKERTHTIVSTPPWR